MHNRTDQAPLNTSPDDGGVLRKIALPAAMILPSFAAAASYFMGAGTNAVVLLVMLAAAAFFAGLIFMLGDRYIKYTLLLPSVVVMFAVTVVPVVFLVTMSLTDVKLMNFGKQWNFVGLANYIHFFTKDRLFLPTFIRTLEYTVLALISQLAIGMGLALLLQSKFRGRNLVSSFLIIPVMTCPMVIAMLWKSMMNSQTGVINNIIRRFGGEGINWLTNDPLTFIQKIPLVGEFLVSHANANTGFLSILIVNTWQWTPFVFLMILAGLNSLPREPFEAAAVDGASQWQVFRNITMPLLRPVMNVVILMRLIDLMKVYDQIYALFGDNITMRTLNIHIFSIGLTNQNYGRGSALSIIVLVFIVILTKIFMRLFAPDPEEGGLSR